MIAILVPVLGRPHQIAPLLANIAETTTTAYRVVLICSPSDSAVDACQATDATTLIVDWSPDKADYAKKIAYGFRNTTEPWLFQGATDLLFHGSWDHHALAVAHKFSKTVIGTNDLGNPSVKRGKHSTHSLIARSYIETYGGTADNTGLVFCEEYDHQYIDNEFIDLARRRGEFFFSRNSFVEHKHPHWGKGEYDDTYSKALRATKQDMDLYLARRKLLMGRK